MSDRRKILFLCTGNSCRSQMAEAMLRHVGGDRFESLSAGSHPAGYVHPLALAALENMNIPHVEGVSKSWDEFSDAELDAVITVCDNAAAETCPTWPGAPITAHWPLPDPAFHPGTDEERIELAMRVAKRLLMKIEALVALDWSTRPQELTERLAFLGEI